MRSLFVLALFAFLPPATAQCPKVTFVSYGRTCAYFGQHARLTGVSDSRTCTITLTVGSSRTCCNTFLSFQALLLSPRKIDPGIPLKGLVSGCLLSVMPDVILPLPRSAKGVVRIPLPQIPLKLVLYAQGLNDYLTTIGLTHDYQTTNGLMMLIS